MTSPRPFLLLILLSFLPRRWPMAIIAYNYGLSGVRCAMRQFGVTAYVDILRKYNGRTFDFASRQYSVPIWLFRQYNPQIDLHRVRPGTKVQFPLLTDVEHP